MSARSVPMKRPAARAAPKASSAKRRKTAQAPRDSIQQAAHTILAAFNGGKQCDIPLADSVRIVLRHVIDGAEVPELQKIEILGKAITDIDTDLQRTVCQLQEKADGEDTERTRRQEQTDVAQSRLLDLRHAVIESKAALASSVEAVRVAKDSVTMAQTGRRSGCVVVKAATKKRAILDVAKTKFDSLKDKQARGAKSQGDLKALRKMGKEFGFHEVLLDAVPAVLRKMPDKRRTFDGIALEQFEKEFSVKCSALDAVVENGTFVVHEHEQTSQEAKEALDYVERQREHCAKAVADAEAALETGKEDLAAAKKHARSLKSDMRQIVQELRRAIGRLSDFRTGPGAAFELLQAELLAKITMDCPLACKLEGAVKGGREDMASYQAPTVAASEDALHAQHTRDEACASLFGLSEVSLGPESEPWRHFRDGKRSESRLSLERCDTQHPPLPCPAQGECDVALASFDDHTSDDFVRPRKRSNIGLQDALVNAETVPLSATIPNFQHLLHLS